MNPLIQIIPKECPSPPGGFEPRHQTELTHSSGCYKPIIITLETSPKPLVHTSLPKVNALCMWYLPTNVLRQPRTININSTIPYIGS